MLLPSCRAAYGEAIMKDTTGIKVLRVSSGFKPKWIFSKVFWSWLLSAKALDVLCFASNMIPMNGSFCRHLLRRYTPTPLLRSFSEVFGCSFYRTNRSSFKVLAQVSLRQLQQYFGDNLDGLQATRCIRGA